ncbi:MAG: carboxypeptidase-like regulatory domain-containing protein [Pyrinomonadaceae bacterium]
MALFSRKPANFELNSISVAKPCPADWNLMTGDERSRLCHDCGLNIYNISEMLPNEVRDLIENREGRLCIRLMRRSDGTVITRDCPKGLAAYRRRVARMAGAVFAAIVGLFSATFAQSRSSTASSPDASITAQRYNLEGVIVDPQGAVIPGVKVTVRTDKKTKYSVLSDSNGRYVFDKPDIVGKVEIVAEKSGFLRFKDHIEIKAGVPVDLRIELVPNGESVEVGIYLDSAGIDMTRSDITTTFKVGNDGTWRPY